MNPTVAAAEVRNYHLLRHALSRFQRRPAELESKQRREAERASGQSLALEDLVLRSPEAGAVTIPESQIDEAIAQVRSRYASKADFLADLAANGIKTNGLREALSRELRFDAVMTRVAAAVPQVTDAEVEEWYHAHPERTSKPERRKVRHILITINPEYPENRREQALARIEAAASALGGDPTYFAELAQERSECPSALDGGLIGTVERGQLYSALDRALFELPAGALSGIIESEIGFHLLWCEAIEPARTASLEDVREQLREGMMEKRRHAAQRTWIERIKSS